MKIEPQPSQSLFDVAIQYAGSVDALVSICRVNNMSITDPVFPGTEIEVPEVSEPRVVKFFSINGASGTNYSINSSFDFSFDQSFN